MCYKLQIPLGYISRTSRAAVTDTATYLREAREQRGLTLDDVAEATRIPRHYLHMMEGEGDSRLISDRLYLVHYVRQYAAHLQIEEAEQLAAQFIRENNRLQPPKRNRPTQDQRKSRRVVPWLLLLLLLVGVGAAYVYEPELLTQILPEQMKKTPTATVNPTRADRATPTPVTPIEKTRTANETPNNPGSEAVSVLQPEANEIVPPKPEPVEPPAVVMEQTPSGTADLATVTTPDRTTATGDVAGTGAADTPTSAPNPPAPIVKDGQRLEIVAKEKSWVRVIVDDQGPQDLMMNPGDSKTWSAKKKFILTFGNAGGVALTLNGTKLSPIGTSGQVVRNYQLPR